MPIVIVFFSPSLDSQDGELDAILKELCALGSQLDKDIKEEQHSSRSSTTTGTTQPAPGIHNA